MEKEGFVGRDISNFAINLFKAGTGTGEGKEITAEVLENGERELMEMT